MTQSGLRLSVKSTDVAWEETGVAGVFLAPLHPAELSRDDPAIDATVLIRMEPGVSYPRHRHLATEEVLVLQGGYGDERGTYVAGAYVRYEPGSAHSARALGDASLPEGPENPACILFASVRGGIELLKGRNEG